MISSPLPSKIPNLNDVMSAIIQAGEKIQEIYDTDFEVNKKDDNSPITQADLESNKILRSVLEKTGIPILSEEDVDDKSRLASEKVWIVDPLDGTQDFVNRTGEFTILVGLVENHLPVMGLVYLPIKKILYFAEKGMGAFCYDLNRWEKISVRKVEEISSCLALVSRHHLSGKERKILDHLGITNMTTIGSTLKVMEISSGRGDIYLTTTNKMSQWDTCASNCIISEAGGKMTDVSGNELIYNTEIVKHENGLLVTNGFIHDVVVSKISEL
jgi:3'(2'), 5'-bisphosphate nucleotidase